MKPFESSLRYHYGVIQLGKDKYRYTITPPINSELECTVCISSPIKLVKYVCKTSVPSTSMKMILSAESIGFNWGNGYGGNILRLFVRNSWIELEKEKYDVGDIIMEDLIQFEKRRKGTDDSIVKLVDETKNSLEQEKEKTNQLVKEIKETKLQLAQYQKVGDLIKRLEEEREEMKIKLAQYEKVGDLIKRLEEERDEMKTKLGQYEKAKDDLTKKMPEEMKNQLAQYQRALDDSRRAYEEETRKLAADREAMRNQISEMKRPHLFWMVPGSSLRIASSSAVSSGNYVVWNNSTNAPYNIHNRFFYSCENSNQITFHHPGLYLVSTHISSSNTVNGNYVSLYHNGSEISRCHASNPSGYYHSFQISNFIVVNNPNEYINIYYSGNTNNYAAVVENQLSIAFFPSLWGESLSALRVSCNAARVSGSNLIWNNTHINTNPTSYTVSNDAITVRKDSWYLVTLQMTSSCSDNACYAEIRLNGNAAARCRSSNGGNYYNPLNFAGIIKIPAGANLTVYYYGNNSSIYSGNSQQLCLLALKEDIISLSSNGCTNTGNVAWNQHDVILPNTYNVGNNNQRITVARGGIYLVCANIPLRDSGNTGYFSIYVNGSDISRARFSEPNSHCRTVCLCEVVQVNTGQYVEMYYNSNSPSLLDPEGTRFSMFALYYF